jgi:hypothetical protein
MGETRWRPIATAPKDGTKVDLWSEVEDRITDAKWHRGAWCTSESHVGGYVWSWDALSYQGRITHWMPLPPPPEANDDDFEFPFGKEW